MAHPILRLVFRVLLALVVGGAIGAGIWAVEMAWQGHSLSSAIHGEVEDGLGLLQGLTALGGTCGTVVGLFWGVVRFRNGSAVDR